jgi:hypothetical protein
MTCFLMLKEFNIIWEGTCTLDIVNVETKSLSESQNGRVWKTCALDIFCVEMRREGNYY